MCTGVLTSFTPFTEKAFNYKDSITVVVMIVVMIARDTYVHTFVVCTSEIKI